ncbi:hypothetical protein phiCTP1_gp81 [Clostridium phage phiCTP1]|uniref:hypothetical protein n=1 Tax=Clostridium phage phiCTP1 TaxID=871584 RepID=UPI0001E07862|nr:hypothetical protein phiCTP1_gp81 [Clostridium phage phiCTP1]ADL40382.1 hypothetical phage protein [Clostridium phage phiCTP1]
MYYWIYETDNSLLVQPLKVIKETPKTVTIAVNNYSHLIRKSVFNPTCGKGYHVMLIGIVVDDLVFGLHKWNKIRQSEIHYHKALMEKAQGLILPASDIDNIIKTVRSGEVWYKIVK